MGFEVTEYAPGAYRAVFVQRQMICSTKWGIGWKIGVESAVSFQPVWREMTCL